MNAEQEGGKILMAIRRNEELMRLEHEGFVRGAERGKIMDVPITTVFQSLIKQWTDVEDAMEKLSLVERNSQFFEARMTEARKGLKRALADLRNVAGCVFLKLQPATLPGAADDRGEQL